MAGPFKHEGGVFSDPITVTFSCDDKHVVSAFDSTIYILDMVTKNLAVCLYVVHESLIVLVSPSPDGKYIAFGLNDVIQVFDVNIGKMTSELADNKYPSFCISFSHDGQRLVSGSSKGIIQIRNVHTGATLGWLLDRNRSIVYSVSFSHSDEFVVSGSYDGTIRVWRVESEELVAGPLKVHERPIKFVAFSNDDRRVISGSWDNSIRIWDVNSNESTTSLPRGHDCEHIAVSTDGKRVVSCTGSHASAIWEVETGAIKAEGPGGDRSVNHVTISRDGKIVAYVLINGYVLLWSVDNDAMVGGPLQLGVDWIDPSLTFSRDNKRLSLCTRTGKIRVWDVDTRELTVDIDVLDWPTQVFSVAFSNNENYIVSGMGDGAIQFWDVNTGKSAGQPLKDDASSNSVDVVAFSYDDKRVASASNYGTVIAWDVDTRRMIAGPFSVGNYPPLVAFSYDVKYVFTTGSSPFKNCDSMISMWDMDARQVVRSFTGHVGRICCIALSHDDNLKFTRLVSGSADKSIRIWDITTETSESIFSDESRWVNGGWVEGKNKERLFWVPLVHRVGLHKPCNRRVIAPNETRLRVDDDLLGGSWVNCYKGFE